MDVYSQALLDYHRGKTPTEFEIVRDDNFSSVVPISMFFDDVNFPQMESLALDYCFGKVLDIGAGAGRHSSMLQKRGIDVTAIDSSEQAVSIMKERGVIKTKCIDINRMTGSTYNTLLMLMNGIGIVARPDNLDSLFIKARELLTDNGILLVDSIDVFKTNDPIHVKYREKNITNSLYAGQQNLRIIYNGVIGSWFQWLHLTFEQLTFHATKNNFISELLTMDENGHYLAKLSKSPIKE